MRIDKLRRIGIGAAAIVAALAVGALPASAAPGDGSAYGAKVNISGPLGIPTVNLGPLAPSSTAGPTEASVVGISGNPIISAGGITSSAIRDDATGHVRARAEIAGVQISMGPLAISAGAITSTCTADQSGNTGAASLAGATILGAPIAANPGPNTRVSVTVPNPVPLAPPIKVADLVLNEQINNADGSLTVNAFHLTFLSGTAIGNLVGKGEIVLASTTCGPAAPPVPLASGLGLWLGVGLLGLVAIVAAVVIGRRRRATMLD